MGRVQTCGFPLRGQTGCSGPALRGKCGLCGAAQGPHPSLGPGEGAQWPPSLERKAGAGPAGGGAAPSADTQTFRRAGTPSPHFRIEKAFPKQLPDPTAAGLDALGGTRAGVGAVGRLWALSSRLVAFCPRWAAPHIAVPESSCLAPGMEAQSPPQPPGPSGSRCWSSSHTLRCPGP